MQLSVVSYLDAQATKVIRDLQQKVSDITGSKASLQAWQPHITIGDGIEIENGTDDLIKDIINNTKSIHPFSVKIVGFGSFSARAIGKGEESSPYVLFAAVIVSHELDELVRKINYATMGYSTWYSMPRPYLPHVTLAFRDLTEDGYLNGLKYLQDKSIELSSLLDHIAFVKKLPNSDVELSRIQLT